MWEIFVIKLILKLILLQIVSYVCFLIKHVSVIVTGVYDSSGGILNLKIEFIQIKYHLNLTSWGKIKSIINYSTPRLKNTFTIKKIKKK